MRRTSGLLTVATFLAALGGCSSTRSSGTATDGGQKTGDAAANDAGSSEAGSNAASSVLQYHTHATRDGAYVDRTMTKAAAAKMHLASGFPVAVTGYMYADPLYVSAWKPGQDVIFAATNANHVVAIDASTGKIIWDVTLGPPVVNANLPCARPFPSYGIMGTPIIDLASRTLYAESFQTISDGTQKHYAFAISIDDGTTRSGWPVDIASKLKGFDSNFQNDRGGLTILNGTLYVPYASVNADCGTFRGWIVGISIADPTQVDSFETTGPHAGIWTSLSSDGQSLFTATGNTAEGTTTWAQGEAVLRLTDGPKWSGATTDYFTPSNWVELDNEDQDLGSSGTVLFDMPGVTPQHLAIAGGKFGVVHLLDRDNLGGVGKGNGMTGEGIFSLRVGTGRAILNGNAATYTTAKGRYVVVHADNGITVCPNGATGNILGLRVTTTSPPTLVPTWCAESSGRGNVMATTTDGTSNALVWTASAYGTNELFAFDGDTGATVFGGGTAADKMGAIYYWTNPIDGDGRIIVGGNGAVYAFTP